MIIKRKIAFDLVPNQPGTGGAGGGIWTYVSNLVTCIDRRVSEDIEITCFVSKPSSFAFNTIKCIEVPIRCDSLIKRLLWVHLLLPLWCLRHKVALLHKFASEIPLVSACPIAINVNDFMAEYYLDDKGDIREFLSGTDLLRLTYFKFMQWYAFKVTRMVFFLTQAIADEAIERYHPKKERLVVAYAGVHTPDDSLVHTNNCGKNLLYIAAFHPHKGHIRAIECVEEYFRHFSQSHDDTKLIFQGNVFNKKYFEAVRKRIEASPFSNRITIKQYDKNLTLNDIYADAAAVLLLSEYEGFGLPVIEAQASGIPVVCSDIPVFREIAGESVLLVNSGKPYETAEKIASLIDNESLRTQVIAKGFVNSKRFTWDSTAACIIETYQTVFSKDD